MVEVKKMSFPQFVSDAALSACGRCCCICHKFCGTKMELHHIKQVAYGGEDTFENCIPLCFDCHADMGKADPYHNKGKKYSEKELLTHRDNWYNVIKEGKKIPESNLSKDTFICDEDIQLFRKIVDSFSKNIQHELKYPNFYYPYERFLFQPLDFLVYEADDPAFFFVNKELEKLRVTLFSCIDCFTNTLYTNTFSIGKEQPDKNASHGWLLNHGYLHEENFHKNYKELEHEFGREVELINSIAKELWEAFSRFVKYGRILFSSKSGSSGNGILQDGESAEKHEAIVITPTSHVYANEHDHGTFSFDYSNNNGEFTIGTGVHQFTTKWSKASDRSIHAYNDAANIESIARIKAPCELSEKPAGDFDFSSRCRTPSVGDVIIWRNKNGKYAATKIISILDDTRGADHDELTCEFIIYR